VIFQSPGSIALQIGPLSIHWYGILIGIGILLAYWYVSAELKRRKLPEKPVDDMAFWLILSGVIGARLYFVLFNLPYFSAYPLDAFKVWQGGLAIHGAIIGGAAAYFIYIFKHKLNWKLYLDVIMPGVLLAQALGRFGNFFNSEAFGGPTNLPWKLFIPLTNRPIGFENIEYFHPTFLYELLWNLVGFVLLILLARLISKKDNFTGVIFYSYLIWYSVGRFFIEGMRLDSLYLGQFRTAQVVSVILFTFGIIGLIFLYKKATIHSTKNINSPAYAKASAGK
jgi:phosphatidylglycerol:prolipoprotein diacylglycerol transferase